MNQHDHPRIDANLDLGIDLPSRLAQRLVLPLPGRPAQERFAPPHCHGQHFSPAPTTARQAAVLILLYRDHEQWHLPLTMRAADMTHHPGQISFPGGRIDTGETAEQAALRELKEEIAILPNDIQILGSLTPIFLFVSNHHVTPIVAWTSSRPDMVPNPSEVDVLIELPLTALLDPSNYQDQVVAIPENVPGPNQATVPTISHENHSVWGATAIILGEFTAILHES